MRTPSVTDDPTSPAARSTSGRVLVGVDGSEPSRRALLWARFIADAMSGSLEVVTVWQPYAAYGYAGEWAVGTEDWNPAEDARASVEEALDAVFGEHRPEGLEVTVREGNPARVLLDASKDASMLVVGSRGRGGFAGLLLGSVSSACGEHATCPVLVVHGDTPPPPAPE